MNNIKQQILEECENAQFIKGLDDKLYGCAEMFGEDCIVLYEGINFIRYTSVDECREKLDYCALNSLKMQEEIYDQCIIGHVKLSDGNIRLVYSKDSIIEKCKEEYMKDDSGLFEDEEDCETSAIENYYYNILGSFMEEIPVFAIVMKY
jgi:hypothetical protein